VMKFRISMCFLVTVFAILAVPVRLATQGPQQMPPNYTITILGATLGGDYNDPGEINNKGEVTGNSPLLHDANTHAFLWQNGVMTDLGTLEGPDGNSFTVWRPSDNGWVGGASTIAAIDPNGENWCGLDSHICLPFMWKDGRMRALPTLGGNNGQAAGANNQGQLVGYTELASNDPSCPAGSPQFQIGGVEWRYGRIQRQFRPLSGDTDAHAFAINERGQVVGVSATCKNATFHAVLWQDGRAIPLGTLGGSWSQAVDINEQGQVVGEAALSGDATGHAFLWQRGRMIDLGTFTGDTKSKTVAINNRGEVAGYSWGDVNVHPVVWGNGGMYDLNAQIPAETAASMYLIAAYGINDRGQILGLAFVDNPYYEFAMPFVATPTTQHWPPHGRRHWVLPDHVRDQIRRHRERGIEH
jgi:probable HAF family extracellular repeat protein